ncbi:MAG TPA: biotin/lipoyl-containing protein, partial [Aestuariivirgaceae bacterium]|nr:biotin/lipoyl-containing protein [Aestuariivirgaceae bacterium]
LRVASGERLPVSQAEIKMAGHAIEARLCAEDPAKGFLPSTGPIVAFEKPELDGLRVDAGVEAGLVISPFYDSMIAKLIASAPDRPGAIARLAQALEETVVAGPKTNASFLHALTVHPAFAAGRMDTGLIARELATLAPAHVDARAVAFGVTHLVWHAHDAAEERRGSNESYSPWSAQDAFQLGGGRRQQMTVLVDGTPTDVHVAWGSGGPRASVPGDKTTTAPEPRGLRVVGNGNPVYVLADMRQIELAWPTYDAGTMDEGSNGSSIRAPIIGRVAKVFVNKGTAVAKGDRIAVVEAMKMEHVLHAPRDGVIEKLAVKEGEQVVLGALIATLAE